MTHDVQLRDVTESDLPIFFEHQRDPEANLLADFPPRDWDAFKAHWAKILVNETGVVKTVLVNGNVAGNVLSFERAGQREVGYWMGREYWGRGIATQALAAFLVAGPMRPFQGGPLFAGVAKHNVASRRVLEKCGFVLSGEEVEFPNGATEPVEYFILKLSPETGPELS